MTPETDTTLGWLQRVQALAPLIEQCRDESERERRMPRPLHEAMLEAGLYSMTLPEAFGGSQQRIEDCIRVIEAVSRCDGATGWNLMIGMHMMLLADFLPADGAREVYDGSGKVVAGSFQPRGKARRVEGGYRLTGQWPFGSNCANAAWLVGAGTIEGEETRVFFFPAADGTILDTWHTTGMKGTGSNDYSVADAFVPERYTYPLADMAVGPRGNAAPVFARPFFDLAGPTLAAVSLGIARDAIEAFVTMAGDKLPARGSWTLGTMHSTHMQLGQAEAMLRSARAYIYEVARELDGPVGADAAATSANTRLASANASHNAMRAVDVVFELAGGSSVYASSRLERCFRDVHMPTHHFIAAQSHYEMVGQYMLGQGLQARR